MSSNVNQLKESISRSGITQDVFCDAAKTIIPILRDLVDNATGWKFWLKWGANFILNLLIEFVYDQCGSIDFNIE